MIDYTDTTISHLIFHHISQENSRLSAAESQPADAEEEQVLKTIFLKPFMNCTNTYEFQHEIDLELNTLFKLSRAVDQEDDFVARSRDIHQHLKSVSKHPNIKDGELFVIRYQGVQINHQVVDALGIYKIENKEPFLETSSQEGNQLLFRRGIGTRKLDKACLVLFTEVPYTVLIIDNVSKETEYWKQDFVHAGFRNDHVNNTNEFLSLTKSFITEQFPTEYESSKADQIDLLNRSVAFFKSNESFEKESFENEVFQQPELIKSFQNFDQGYRLDKEVALSDNFEISAEAVKKQARGFKSILKLDKNFHVYIHGNRQLIQQGEEPDGRKFYKLYYTEES